ncbi:20490_t:CDS:2, partial [Gigaspora rosea]
VTNESPTGMFSEDMFDASIIELNQLIDGLDQTKIYELWRITTIDQKSIHFIVLYENNVHLCTCLTLINHGLVCHHFFAVMLCSKSARFHIGLILQRWYLDTLVEDASISLEPAIVVGLNSLSDASKNITHMDFSTLENIHGKHVFSKSVHHEMIHRHQWGKGFGMMKKTLNLAIMTNKTKELYKIHENFAKEMELELMKGNDQIVHNNFEELAHTIKYDKPDNDDISDSIAIIVWKASGSTEERKGVKKCSICNLKGHNACTCLNLVESSSSDDEDSN